MRSGEARGGGKRVGPTPDTLAVMNYQRLYEYRFRDIDQTARAAVWREIAVHIHDLLGRPKRVLDPAAGRGEFINSVPAAERWSVDQVAYAEGTYAPEVHSIVSDVLDAELPEGHFDGVFVSNFLEHLPTQEVVATFLERMHSVSAPGGRIAIMGPNFRYCASEYFDMADHTLIFTHRAIAEHLYAAGFEPERIEPRFLPYSFTGRLPPSAALTRRYLRTPVAWRVLGKQFLVIGRR
jgi:2-polyprenyl-3-methyl-5-hydroxy-6-metoxy-1,4-benzoquinol methylase